jgi:hypothetical protein
MISIPGGVHPLGISSQKGSILWEWGVQGLGIFQLRGSIIMGSNTEAVAPYGPVPPARKTVMVDW